MTRRLLAAELVERAAVHAALGDPTRLAIAELLVCSDRSPGEIAERLEVPTNLLAHHLTVLEDAGVIARTVSSGDGRRRYVTLTRRAVGMRAAVGAGSPRLRSALFLCTHNSARSQLAAALWTRRTGLPAASAGTQPAEAVHPGAVAAARRSGLDLSAAIPTSVKRIPAATQVITVCDLVHEDLEPTAHWWHWSTPDPVVAGDGAAFDDVVRRLDERIGALLTDLDQNSTHRLPQGDLP